MKRNQDNILQTWGWKRLRGTHGLLSVQPTRLECLVILASLEPSCGGGVALRFVLLPERGENLLEGGFEIVDDPKEDEDGIVEDKNRKVMTSLQHGDMVQGLYNTSRIVGLEACEGLIVIGQKCLYMQDNFFHLDINNSMQAKSKSHFYLPSLTHVNLML